MKNKVAYLIGSASDQKFAEASIQYFDFFEIESSIMVMSAHRNPDEVKSFASKAKEKLNWVPKISFEQLVKEMTDEDLKLAKNNKLINR
jgi:GDP-D-mannose dehydratase